MENKLVTKKFISDYSPCLYGTGEESTMFHNEKYLLKFIKSEFLKDDREQIIKRLEELSHPNIVIPEFLLHDRKSFLGYGMIYYSDYTSLDKIVSDTIFSKNKDYPFEVRKKIVLKLYETLEFLKRQQFAFYDIHGGNFLIKDEDVKIVDLDSGVFKGTTNANVGYHPAYLHSSKQFALFALSFIYNTDWMKFKLGFEHPMSCACQNKENLFRFLPDNLEEFYRYALGNDYYIYNDTEECLNDLDEPTYEESLQILQKRL